MPLKPGCERRPAAPDLNYIPPSSYPYTPKAGESWWTLADKAKALGHPEYQGDRNAAARKLLQFNFKTDVPAEVNWYLYHKVGCRKPTQDNLNYTFAGLRDKVDVVYLPILDAGEIVVPGKPPVDAPANPLKGVWVGVGGKIGGANNLMPPPINVPVPGEPYKPPRGPGTIFPLPDIYGNDQIAAGLYSLDMERRGEMVGVTIDIERTGIVWGGGGGMVVVIVSGLDGPAAPQKLQGYTSDGLGLDFSASIGGAWGALAKRGKDVPGLKRLIGILMKNLRPGESWSPEKWEKIWEQAKLINGLAGLNNALGKIELTIIDVPGLGGGMEVGLFGSTTKVKTVTGTIRAFGA
jgi:hypothetical protein